MTAAPDGPREVVGERFRLDIDVDGVHVLDRQGLDQFNALTRDQRLELAALMIETCGIVGIIDLAREIQATRRRLNLPR